MAKLQSRLNSALLPLGFVALVAGCGGGSVVTTPGGTAYVPVGPKQPVQAGTAKATISLFIPVRGGSAGARQPRYVGAGTKTVSVSVAAAGQASPWPLATSTSVPTPGPLPSGGSPTPIPVSIVVDAPLGNAQFGVNTYNKDGILIAGAVSSPTPIVGSGSNTVNLTLNASVQCVQINHSKSALVLSPLENQSSTQTATFVVTPCDIDGNVIPAGQTLANSLIFTKTNPNQMALSIGRTPQAQAPTPTPSPAPSPTPLLSFSPASITQGGDQTVTVTYAAGAKKSETQYVVPSGASPTSSVSTVSINANPIYDVLVSNSGDGTVSVLEFNASGSYLNNPGSGLPAPTVPVGAGPSQIAGASPANGCGQGGQAMTTNDTAHTISMLGIPVPVSMTSPNPIPNTPAAMSGLATAASTVAIAGCNVYIGTGSYLWSLFLPTSSLAASGNGPYSNPQNGQPAFTYGNAPVTAAAAIGSSVYVGLGATSGYLNNIVDIANGSLYPGFAPSTDAMTAYDASHVAIAYHTGGYLHFGLFDGSTFSHDTSFTGNPTIVGMAVDSAGNIDAISNGTTPQWLQYIPSAASVSANNLSGLYPSGIAVWNQTMYVTDTGGAKGAGFVYVYPCFGCVPASYPVGTTPSGVTIVP